jgi:hypothetical protein
VQPPPARGLGGVNSDGRWDSENRLTGVQLPAGGLNTMAYRADNLRHELVDSEGNKLMVRDELGYSGYVDVVEENLP